MYDQHMVLTDAESTVVADSEGEQMGQHYEPTEPGRPIGVPFGGSPVGFLYVDQPDAADFVRASLQITYQSIGRFFLWGGLLAIAVALLLATMISRRMLAPVRALTGAARRLGKGDFSQRVQTKDKSELGELAESFNSMADDLERAERLRRNMVADVAHELRTPLSNLSGYLEAISDGVLKPDKAAISSLREEATTLSRLVTDLQELSLADAGELKLTRQPEDMAQLIKQAVAAQQSQASAKGLTVKAELPPGLPEVNVDAHRIGQVLRNLLDNAVAHTPGGGSVTLTAVNMGDEMKIRVTDTGEGIPPDDLPNIFERFYRVDRSRTRSTGGTGLGLTITRRLVEAHGGRIEAESDPGRGSTFTITLPLGERLD
jgi:signal transduction histidine kinase